MRRCFGVDVPIQQLDKMRAPITGMVGWYEPRGAVDTTPCSGAVMGQGGREAAKLAMHDWSVATIGRHYLW
jgi:hypothetical protein